MPLVMTLQVKTSRTYPQLRSHLAKIKQHYLTVEFGKGDALTAFIFTLKGLADALAVAEHMRQLGSGDLTVGGNVAFRAKSSRPKRAVAATESIASLGLPPTLVAFLASRHQLTTVGQLTARSFHDLKALKGVGQGKALRIKAALEQKGYALARD